MIINRQMDINFFMMNEYHIVLMHQGELRFLDSSRQVSVLLQVPEEWLNQNARLKLATDPIIPVFIGSQVYYFITSYANMHKKVSWNPNGSAS